MFFAAGYTWWHLLGIAHDSKALVTLPPELAEPHGYGHSLLTSLLVVAVVVVFSLLGRLALNKAQSRQGVEKYFSTQSLGILTIAELLISFWRGLAGGNLAKTDARVFAPLLTGMFLYIFVCNITGMIPGFLPPTENVHHNWAMSICAFLLFVGAGLLRDPVYFIKHLFGPVLLLAPLLFVIELIGLFVRPATLTIRLTGNMFGDHTVFTVMSDLVPWLVPVPFLGLALLVSAIQAFIFTLLTVIYIALSVPHGDHH